MSDSATVQTGQSGWRKRYPALTYPNFQLWFAGQLVSLFGTWMQTTAQGYLVYQLTGSPIYLGYVSFASGLPTWLFTLYGGVVADRVPRRLMLIATQSSMMILAFILAALTALHRVQPWHIIVLAFLLGVANAFDAPARQAFTLEMVERHDLTNAIVLNATMFNAATAVGPAAAGIVYSLVGPAWCFFLNGVSFIAVILALLMMKLKPFVAALRTGSTLDELKEGLRYVVASRTILILLVVVGTTNLFGQSFATLIPAWAVRILGGDATTNGLLQSARGLGALICALLIASLGRFNYRGKLVTLSTFALPITLLIFAHVRWLPLSLLALLAIGMAAIPIINLCNSIVQTEVPDVLRGRVMGVYMLIFMGMWPLGGLWAGTVAQQLGEPPVVVIGASIVLAVAAGLYVFFPKLRALE
jgi:MFS family permease